MSGVADLDLARSEIPVAVPINPDLVRLEATNCQWVSLQDMEKVCEVGDSFAIKKVTILV